MRLQRRPPSLAEHEIEDPQQDSDEKPLRNRSAWSPISDEDKNDVGEDKSDAGEDKSDAGSGKYVPRYYEDDESESGSHVTTFDELNEEFGRWSAPQEPLRPENPYKKGQILNITKHTACAPFGQDYPNYEGVRERAPERELRSKTLVDLCLDRPPVGGETAAAGEEAQTLEILDGLRVREDGGAQIVVCRVSGKPQELVAKIYDPLYYGFAHRMWSDQPRDVTYEADMDYSREVAAYLELDGQLGGADIPKYHGSWTFQLPLELPGGKKTRHVRLVLMEHIEGTPMTDLKPELYPESTRMDLVTRMVETVARVDFAGVSHGDVSQRNVMVCLTQADTVDRVALIDFNYAVVDRLDDFEEQFPDLERRPKPAKMPNPIDRWWGGGLYSVVGEWLPASWEFRWRALQDWLYEKYGKSEEYAPPRATLDWDEENVPQVWIAT
ncbi:hypothetical protein KVR01_006456 [Diaporthe batatas]|uniref:uncharacterized protein n=1 Tax=Diaporthe batatas TaxID=748121 RepID=UPI001D03B1CE|nr:uncharacterized protein KVR01_006456 [Diaporthe batatas]KAG8164538.1 hypothetical protein KVR01_006456 [Diaporthe batatas]